MLSPLALAAFCLLLLYPVIHAGWSFDDPVHLRFALNHSPAEYFFGSREVMLKQSYAHITPWNALFYDIGLPVAGLDARWHHVHLLIVVWACACATWAFLRRWLGDAVALCGAMLFLAVPPLGSVAFTVTTAHYVYGLLFCILALHTWARAVESTHMARALGWAVACAVFYALACLCKELYVPLPLVLLCFPSSQTTWARRWRLMVPVCVVAAGYAGLRVWLFGISISGYAGLASGHSASWSEAAMRLFVGGRRMLLGPDALGWAALVLSVLLLLLGVGARRRLPLLFTISCLVALVLPLLPAARIAFDQGEHRVLMAAAWAWVICLAFMIPKTGSPRRLALAGALLLACILASSQHQLLNRYSHESRIQIAENGFLASAGPDQSLLPWRFMRVGYLESMAAVASGLSARPAATVLATEEALMALGPERGQKVMAWSAECACIRPLGMAYEQIVSEWQRRTSAGQGLPWRAEFGIATVDASRRVFSWNVEPGKGQAPPARVWLDIASIGRVELGPQGSQAVGIDITTPLWAAEVPVRVLIETTEGAWVRSPLLQLPLTGANSLQWTSGTPDAAGASASVPTPS